MDSAALRESLRWLPDDQLCGAKTRAGYPCRGVPVYRLPGKPGRARCRMHGGYSTGPQTDAGEAEVSSRVEAVPSVRRHRRAPKG